jgi:hypothetical protein
VLTHVSPTPLSSVPLSVASKAAARLPSEHEKGNPRSQARSVLQASYKLSRLERSIVPWLSLLERAEHVEGESNVTNQES